MKAAIYCVYTGPFGTPSAVLPKIPDNPFFDYYFFTNNKVLFEEARVHPFWTPVWIDEETPDDYSANMACKSLKAMPHREPILNSYDYTVYLDTKINFGEHHWGITITEEYIRDVLYETDKMRLFHHTEPRTSVLDELDEALYQERYANEEDRIRAYMAQKKIEGYRKDCEEFLLTGYIFRKMRDRDVERVGDEWYEEIQKCGLECQISFHYMFQKFKEFIKPIKREENTHFDYLEIGTSDFDTFTEKYPNKKVISVEPLAQYLDALPDRPNHIKVQFAVCDQYEEYEQEIYYIPDRVIKEHNLAWWLRGCNKIGGYHAKHEGFEHLVEKQIIHFMTLDDLYRRYNVKRVDHIKIDTEGFEVPILRALYRKMVREENNWPKTIQYEVNSNSDTRSIIEITSKLMSLGYKLTDFNDDIILTYDL